MIRRPPRSTQSRSSAASDVYKRQPWRCSSPRRVRRRTPRSRQPGGAGISGPVIIVVLFRDPRSCHGALSCASGSTTDRHVPMLRRKIVSSRIPRRPMVFGRWLVVAVAMSALLLAACGGAPTAEPAAPEAGTEAAEAPATEASSEGASPSGGALEAVYAELEGLTGDERRAALIELATDECEEPVDLYTSINVEITQSMIDQFIEDTGVPAELYRAANEDVNRRVLEEEDADVADVADVIANNDLEQEILDREGLLAPLDTPATEGNSVVTETWAGADRLVYMAAWGDSLEDPPSTWEDVFNAEGLAFQLGDVNWFATLVNDYYVAEQGMTEREAVDMVAEAVRGSQIVNGHTLGAQLLTSGEYRVASSLYLTGCAP